MRKQLFLLLNGIMAIKWRKWNRAIHRDLGYFFFGMTLIYGISGIAVNHIKDWNPNYVIEYYEVETQFTKDASEITLDDCKQLISLTDLDLEYKKHYFPRPDVLRIFVKGGSLSVDLNDGMGEIELLHRRPLFYHVNYLHYNPFRWWTWFSDIFAGALILMAITGLFILKGKNGITGRGAWLTIAGLLIPIITLIIYT